MRFSSGLTRKLMDGAAFGAALATGAPGAVASPKFGAGDSFRRLQGFRSWWSWTRATNLHATKKPRLSSVPLPPGSE